MRIFSCTFTTALAYIFFAYLRLLLRASSLMHLYLPLQVCSYICYCKFAITFAIANLLLCICYCKTLLAIYLWSIIIVRLCLQSICGQSSLQNFACNLSLDNYYCMTLLVMHPWTNIIARLCSQFIFRQLSLYNCC